MASSFQVIRNTEDISGAVDRLASPGNVSVSSGDYVYVGLERKFFSFFFYMTYVSGSYSLIVEYWNGAGWTILPVRSLVDNTDGCRYSGIVQFETSSGWKIKDGFYELRLTMGPNITLKCLTVLFAWDTDLKREFSPILGEEYRLGESDFRLKHESVRDDIVQHFRNRGFSKVYNGISLIDADKSLKLTYFDLMDVDEVKIAAVYLALHKIFFDLADGSQDERWAKKASYYLSKYEKAIDLAYVTFDKYSNGLAVETRLTESRLVR